MLMKPEKKGMVSIIMSKLGKPSEMEQKPMENGAEQDDSIALETAAEEILAAVKSDSPKALIEAMKSFIELCDQAEDAKEMENEQE